MYWPALAALAAALNTQRIADLLEDGLTPAEQRRTNAIRADARAILRARRRPSLLARLLGRAPRP